MTNYALPGIPVSEDPANSATLPSEAYTDQAFLDLEKRELFYKTWHFAGWVGNLKGVGDYVTTTLIDQRVIIIRGRDGELAGFHNVCQHRGHHLLVGSGTVASITCPYHAWVYGIDGQLQRARGSATTMSLDVDAIQLTPIRVEVVSSTFVFFNLDMDAVPLAPQISDFIEDLHREIPGFGSLVQVPFPESSSDGDPMFPVEANWKVVMENFLECYHCRGAHPKFSEDLTLDNLTYEGHKHWAKQKSGTRRPGGGNQIFWTLFPNLVIGTNTGDNSSLFIGVFAVPDGPTRTVAGLFEMYRMAGDEHGEDFRPDWGPLGAEDRNLCESVQQGLQSLGYTQGRFVYTPDQGEVTEEASHAFSRFVLDAVGI